jgi:hypothetical protein
MLQEGSVEAKRWTLKESGLRVQSKTTVKKSTLKRSIYQAETRSF